MGAAFARRKETYHLEFVYRRALTRIARLGELHFFSGSLAGLSKNFAGECLFGIPPRPQRCSVWSLQPHMRIAGLCGLSIGLSLVLFVIDPAKRGVGFITKLLEQHSRNQRQAGHEAHEGDAKGTKKPQAAIKKEVVNCLAVRLGVDIKTLTELAA